MADEPRLPDRPMADVDAADERARRSKVWFWRTLVTALVLIIAGVYRIWHEGAASMQGSYFPAPRPPQDLLPRVRDATAIHGAPLMIGLLGLWILSDGMTRGRQWLSDVVAVAARAVGICAASGGLSRLVSNWGDTGIVVYAICELGPAVMVVLQPGNRGLWVRHVRASAAVTLAIASLIAMLNWTIGPASVSFWRLRLVLPDKLFWHIGLPVAGAAAVIYAIYTAPKKETLDAG
ncbi:MAG TPA: hypothetical protein QGH10_14270 [Armatimonadota bacterium]|jgi:hypothetical protein|nr:hypothetical protein [Armatimonadota bacterium]